MSDSKNHELAELLRRAKSHVMTPAERREQKISFIYGLLDENSTVTKEQIAKQLDEWEGPINVG